MVFKTWHIDNACKKEMLDQHNDFDLSEDDIEFWITHKQQQHCPLSMQAANIRYHQLYDKADYNKLKDAVVKVIYNTH